MYEDVILFYRFLKARNFDLDAAESMLRKHITWRKVNQFENILQDFKPMEVFVKCIYPSILGFTKNKSLLIYLPSGRLDSGEVDKCMPMQKLLKHFTWYFANCFKHIEDRNSKIGIDTLKISVILDVDKVTFSNAANKKTTELYLGLTNMFQNNFPETMKAMYVINAPSMAMVVISVCKMVMSREMVKKIHVYGISGWKEKLLEDIDADVLPAFLGGKLTDPDGDPLCKTFVKRGGKIPSKYFLTHEERFIKKQSGLSKVTVPSSGKKEVGFTVDEKGSLIRWGFMTKGSIGFGLLYESLEHGLEEIIPILKFDTSDRAEKDYCTAQYVGKYIIIFDNSSSWMNSKEVEFYVEVIKPET